MKFKFPRPVKWVGDCCHPVPIKSNGKEREQYPDPTQRGDYCGVKIDGVRWPAHRLSYNLNKSPVPNYPGQKREGLVLHTCDHKWCVNPDHLYLGTAKQNAQDNAARNPEWLEKRREIQRSKGFPPVSEEGRRRMAKANSERMKRLWTDSPEEARRQRGIS